MIRMFLNKGICIGLIVLAFSFIGCAKNPDTGEWQPDYPTIAEATKGLAQSLSFEGLKWMYENKPEQVVPTYNDLSAVKGLIGKYTDGSITVGEVATSAVDIFNRIKDRFDIPDHIITTFITGAIATLSGTLNIVITAVPDNAAMVLTSLGEGIDAGLTQYNAWASSQTPPVGVM